MNKIAMLLDNPFTNDRRVYREAKTLVDAGYDLTLYCTQEKSLPINEVIDGIKVERIFPVDTYYNVRLEKELKGIARDLVKRGYKIFHCHDHNMLQVGAYIKAILPSATLILDSHELFHLMPNNPVNSRDYLMRLKVWVVRKIQNYREKKNSKYIDFLITVNDSLASYLGNYFNIKKDVLVIRNIPEYVEAYKNSNIIREKFNIQSSDKILVFIGANIFTKTLNLEQVMDEFGNKPNTSFVFISSFKAGKTELEQRAKSLGYKNIYFHPLLKPTDINEYLSSCDVGLVPTWNKKDLSYWYALDNKLFEYLISEIPILATIQPEYKNIVEQYKIGECINPDKKGSYFKGFEKIIGNVSFYQNNMTKAKKELNWDIEKQKLLDFYSQNIEG